MLKLIRPLCFFDLETTGVETETARIVEIACIKIHPNGTTEEKNIRVNPQVPIPLEASSVHGITDDMVKDLPPFSKYAKAVRDFFYGCDLGGYNSNSFDVPLLSAEFERCGLEGINWNPALLDVLSLYRHLYPNTLSDVYKRLTGKDLEDAHSALADIIASKEIAEILIPQIEGNINTVEDVDVFLQGEQLRVDLSGKLYKDVEGVVRYGFGKDKGKSVKDNPGFGEWMLKNGFPKETKEKLKEIIYG